MRWGEGENGKIDRGEERRGGEEKKNLHRRNELHISFAFPTPSTEFAAYGLRKR